jgi:OFA family oxalate/formate antiporter-like MFS transporter
VAGMGVNALNATLFVYGFSAFFIPWRESFGWSRALLGGVVGLARLEGGLVAPVAGWFIDRYGTRRMMFVGMGMMGIGFILLSRVNSLPMLYVVFLGLLAAGSSFGTNRPVQVAVANWFVRRRGRAMGLIATGNAIGGSIIFLFAMVIETFGWRTAAVFAGFMMWIVGLPIAWFIRHKPEAMGLLPDGDEASIATSKTSDIQTGGDSSPPDVGFDVEHSADAITLKPHHFWMKDPRPEMDLTVSQALKTRAFWFMAVAWALWAAIPGITTVHIAPFLAEELGLEYVVAMGALSFFVFASIFGRLGIGFLAEVANIRLLAALLLIVQGVGIFLFSQVQTLAEVPFYVITFAIPYGGLIAIRPVLQGYFFGRRQFGTIGGLLQFVDLPATVLAPVWVGWLADNVQDGYRVGFHIIALTLVVAAGCILLTRRPYPSQQIDG